MLLLSTAYLILKSNRHGVKNKNVELITKKKANLYFISVNFKCHTIAGQKDLKAILCIS